MGRHSIGAKTEPMQAINPPRDPAPETTSMPAITPADVAAYDQQRKAMTPEEWMQPLRPGGPADRRTELTLRLTLRSRGLALWRSLRKAVGR